MVSNCLSFFVGHPCEARFSRFWTRVLKKYQYVFRFITQTQLNLTHARTWKLPAYSALVPLRFKFERLETAIYSDTLEKCLACSPLLMQCLFSSNFYSHLAPVMPPVQLIKHIYRYCTCTHSHSITQQASNFY